MVIRSVGLFDVRNHTGTEISCAQHVNILTGKNGSGKTSVLEAIGMCAIGRSFVPVSDAALIRNGAEFATMVTTAVRDVGVPWRVKAVIREGARKRLETSLAANVSVRDIIGELPIVAMSPDHKAVTFGAPVERRAFVDAVMAQASTRYRDLLFELRRVLKQRNATLALQADDGTLQAWTEAFVLCGAEIVRRRRDFVQVLTPRVQEAYRSVSAGEETIALQYEADHVPNVATASAAEIAASLAEAAKALHAVELRRGTTMFGPQKDDVNMMLNGRMVRETASQGQHKSLLVALKLAECTMLRDARNERPVVLLDDIFSELDRERCTRVMHDVLAMGLQCFVTTTEGEAIRSMVPSGIDVLTATLANGRIIQEQRSS